MSYRIPECNGCECKQHVWTKTSQWGVAIVDWNDAEFLERYSWFTMNPRRLSSYAKSGRCKLLLHRAILNIPNDVKIDHINGNGLDCRRINLRPASQQQNTFNKRQRKNSTSKFKGLHFKKANKKLRTITDKWVAQIRVDDKCKLLGYFHNEIDAAICYNYNAAYSFGEYARLNNITTSPHD